MKKFFLIIAVIFLALNANAQKKFLFDADYALFKYNDSKDVIEIYFAFYQNSFVYSYSDMNYIANAYLQVKLVDNDNGNTVMDKDFLMQLKNTDSSSAKLKSKELSQLTLFIDNNHNYKLILVGSDNKISSRSDTLKFDFFTKPYNTGKVELSDIQLSSSIVKSTNKESNLYKFGYEIIPNPNALFGNNIPVLWYYLEIYNLKKNNITTANIIFSISNNKGDTINKIINPFNDIKDVVNYTADINIDSLPSGSYFLNVSISSGGNIIESTSKKFYIYNTTKNIYSTSDDKELLQSELSAMKETELDEEFAKIIYIRNDVEKNEYEKLKTEQEKRRFLYNFWKRKDTNPITPKFEFREEYLNRYKKANAQFKQSFMDGWKTDRGRIYMIYGPPDEIERHEMEADLPNYQIWYYHNLEGGAIVVFAENQASGQGYLYQVHSTFRNEFRDDNWMQKLRKIR